MPARNHYEIVVIGAGLSGLAAAIRLGHYEKDILLVERHHLPGGLNSYYRHHGRLVDTGLHAITNFSPPGVRSAPLNRLLRQLRLSRDALELCEQTRSTIEFPDVSLAFTNDFSRFEDEIAEKFPTQISGFRALVREIRGRDSLALDAAPGSAREFLGRHLDEPLLREMLLCPVMFYGNAMEHDMELNQFCIMFQSLFFEGFCRPRQGMRRVLDILLARLKETGAEIRFGCGVERMHVRDNRIAGLTFSDGSTCTAGAVLSCAGHPETLALCDTRPAPPPPAGVMSFVETVFFLDRPPFELGLEDAIRFVSASPRFVYAAPAEPVSFASAVICVPENFRDCRDTYAAGQVRLTQMADHRYWSRLGSREYHAAKTAIMQRQIDFLEERHPGFRGAVQDRDMFTPRTITRYTGHLNGTVYGSPVKQRDGRTGIENLFLCGTDQGFLGIVGSLLSGASMANLHFLS